MAIQSSYYITDGTTRTYPSSKHIASKLHVAVYFQTSLTSVWSIVESSQYEVVNNSVVFYTAPVETVYSQIEIRVADTSAELEDSPSDIAIVAGAISEVITVSNNISAVENVNNNMGSVTTVSGNTTNLNLIADEVIPNLSEILLADDNALIATNKASEASASATLAQTYAESIAISSLVKNVDAIADLATINPTTIGVDNVFVKDLDRGGLFVWSSTGTANGITVFAGLTGYWNRQYSGVIKASWGGFTDVNTDNYFEYKLQKTIQAMRNGDAVTITCFGDSITEGTLGEDYPSKLEYRLRIYYRNDLITVNNAGVGGNTSAQMLSRFDADVVSTNPDLVIVMGGMNDLRLATVEAYANNMNSIFDKCIQNGYGLVALDITPRWRTDNDGWTVQGHYREALRGLVSAMGIPFVPLYDIFQDLVSSENGYDVQALSYDGTHYFASGYMEIAGAIIAYKLADTNLVLGVGDSFDCIQGYLSFNTNAGYEYVLDDTSLAPSRLIYTQNNSTENNITVMFWVENYTASDLVAYVKMGQYDSTLGVSNTLICRNVEITDSALVIRQLNRSGTGEYSRYGCPIVLCQVKPGWNSININSGTNGRKITFDMFSVNTRNNNVPILVSEKYSNSVVTFGESLQEYKNLQNNSMLSIANTASATIGEIYNSSLISKYMSYAFYVSIPDGTSIKMFAKSGRSLTNKALTLFEITFTRSGTTVVTNRKLHGDEGIVDLGDTTHTSINPIIGDTYRIVLSNGSSNWYVGLIGKGKVYKSVLSNAFCVGVSNIIINNTSGSTIGCTELISLPTSSSYNNNGTPVDGEQFIDYTTKSRGVIFGGNYYYTTDTLVV